MKVIKLFLSAFLLVCNLMSLSQEKSVPEKQPKRIFYEGMIEVNGLLGNATYDAKYYAPNEKPFMMPGINIINGIHFCKRYFLGAGFGLSFHPTEDIITGNYLSYLVFFDFRTYFFNRKLKPYIGLSGGTLINKGASINTQSGFFPYINPSLGLKIPVSRLTSFDIGVGYLFTYCESRLLTYGSPELDYRPTWYAYITVNNYIHCLSLKVDFVF